MQIENATVAATWIEFELDSTHKSELTVWVISTRLPLNPNQPGFDAIALNQLKATINSEWQKYPHVEKVRIVPA